MCDRGTQDEQIKTVLFILRIIDKEESYVQSDAFTPYTLTLACARAKHVPAARDRQNRHTMPSVYLVITRGFTFSY
jgi:hypothetical protein